MCKNAVRWVYRLDRNYAWDSGLPFLRDYVFFDSDGKVRLLLEGGGRVTVTRGYAWNGCSPKICLFDILVGTPDGVVHRRTGRPKTYFASLVHDALYQFLEADSPITRAQADACFLRLMAESDFLLRHIYWLAVRAIGRFVWLAKRTKRKWRGRGIPAEQLVGARGTRPVRADAV